MPKPLENVQDLFVTPEDPPRQIEELDPERCTELHNAILEHGWLNSGRSIEEFQSQCTPFHERTAGVIDEKYSASINFFFQGAENVPPGTNDFNFFYNASGLHCAFGLSRLLCSRGTPNSDHVFGSRKSVWFSGRVGVSARPTSSSILARRQDADAISQI